MCMRGSPIPRDILKRLYTTKKQSSHEIAKALSCSDHKVNYWIEKHNIKKRSISDAVYIRKNPHGDPFAFSPPKNPEDWFLFGLGLGLYWGEGNKKNKLTVRIGNTDPALVKKFLEFLEKTYKVEKRKIRFGLQIFSDMSPKKALRFWCDFLKVSPQKFGKVIITPARSIGTYREKTKHGVLTVYVSNKKLRDLICNEIEKLKQM